MDLNVGINYKNEMPKFTGEMSHFLPKKTLCSIYRVKIKLYCAIIYLLYCANIHGRIRDSPFASRHVVPNVSSKYSWIRHECLWSSSLTLQSYLRDYFAPSHFTFGTQFLYESKKKVQVVCTFGPSHFTFGTQCQIAYQQFLSRQIKSPSHHQEIIVNQAT
jgi:hypothetical protein